MLTIPSGIRDNQSFLSMELTGSSNTDNEIPITSYIFSNDSLHFLEYASDGLIGLEKSMALSSVKKNEVSNLLSERTFWMCTDKYGRDLLSRILVGSRISFSIGFIAVLILLSSAFLWVALPVTTEVKSML